jgi:hypothetical protein
VIAQVQTAVAKQCGLIAIELRAEDKGNDLSRAYIYNVQPGTVDTRMPRDAQGSIATF